MDNQTTPNTPTPAPRRRLPVGGIILLVVGILWLLNNVGLSWVNSIWLPVIVIVIGLTIITKR